MSADILRRAASLMRERAGAANGGRWMQNGFEYDDEADARWMQNGFEYDDEADAFTYDIAASLDPSVSLAYADARGNAAHIASWHPAVALAVADWLDDQLAAFLEVRPGNYLSTERAVAVARAYLGESA